MTMCKTVQLSCPLCQHEQMVRIWSTINVTLDPELRVRLFNDDINVFRCESCDSLTHVEKDLLYHDMTRKFCVRYTPPISLSSNELLAGYFEGYDLEGGLDIGAFKGAFQKDVKMFPYIVKPHIMFDLNEMLRYITFRELLWGRDSMTHTTGDRDEDCDGWG